MAETDNKAVRKGGDRLRERFSKSFPDRKFEGETADDDIMGTAADELDRYEGENTRYRQAAEKFDTLFGQDDRMASLVRAAAEGQDPLEFLLENFGDDFMEALQSDEGKAKFEKAREKWLKNKADDEAFQQQGTANLQASIDALHSFADAHNLDDDAAVDLFMKVHSFVEQGLDGIYTEEMYQAAYNAGNYDRDVEVARREGEVTGRNANIRRKLMENETAGGAVPTLGGKNVAAEENAPEPKPASIGLFGDVPIPSRNRKKR